ncbi:MAG: hypothetical protein EPO21_00015 [Chloroflexota bacterium]|nr:MAG: hypothetical protein EPO21_00015 [Chloroflexota bacterium]
MKFDRSQSIRADYRRLTERERELFRQAVRQINDAFARRQGGALPVWPSALRVKPVQGAPGVWEMTWSFTGPDGRATFEFITIDREPAILWRRIGSHSILREP